MANAPAPGDLAEVGVYPNYAVGAEHGLVVLAMGLPYWLEPRGGDGGGGFVLRVESPAAAAVSGQLSRYTRERVGWPPPPPPISRSLHAGDLLLPLLWALVLVAAFWASARWPALAATGTLDARALFEGGEWWRPATALFLHADAGHLISNALSGVFVFTAVAATFGVARGGWSLLVASFLGNTLSAAAQYPDAYRSVGASTAVFAGLGLLTGRAVRAASRRQGVRRWQALLGPAGAGITVLALYGAGGQRVDVGAHLCGFLAGLALGVFAPPARNAAAARN